MSAITLADVDDYINPSQACINPLFTSEKNKNSENDKRKKGPPKTDSSILKEDESSQSPPSIAVKTKKVVRRRRRTPLNLNQPHPKTCVTLESDDSNSLSSLKRPTISYAMDDLGNGASTETIDANKSQSSTTKKSEKATVSVADCLACSGCITSAEAVLVTTQHSIKTLVEKCIPPHNANKRIVFTISPASIADLTRVLAIDRMDDCSPGSQKHSRDLVYRKLVAFLREKFDAEVILDGTIPLRISLYESALEFCHRYQFLHGDQLGIRSNHEIKTGDEQMLDARIDIETPTIALSSTETRFLLRGKGGNDQLEAIEVKHDAGIDSRLKFLQSSAISNQSTPEIDIKPTQVLPMLASSCPGFVCYVEKTVKDAIPNLCSVKSPMAIAGSMFKHGLVEKIKDPCDTYGVPNQIIEKDAAKQSDKEIYHVSIMPCHDKKLEAERKDLAWEIYNEQQAAVVPDVDLVITTKEILSFITDAAMENKKDSTQTVGLVGDHNLIRLECTREYFKDLPLCSAATANSQYASNPQPLPLEEGISTMKGSGSYAEFIFRFASSALFGYDIPCVDKLPWKKSGDNGNRRSRSRLSQSKNKGDNGSTYGDSSEITLYRHSDGTFSMEKKENVANEAVLSFATAYGFKNIQLMMQRVASGDAKMHGYQYIEVMACPSGCANGGGQSGPEPHASGGTNRRERPSEVRNRVNRTREFMDDVVPWKKGGDVAPSSEIDISEPRDLLHTRFHVVPKLELSTGAAAGVAVDDTQW